MKFKDWLVIQEAKGVVNRGGNNIQRRPIRQNDDLPLNRAPVALAAGISSSIMQNLEKSGADHQGTPSVPSYSSDDMEKGEIMDDQGVTYAELPLQIPSIMHNGNPSPAGLDTKKMRTKDNINGDPSVDGLYIVFDDSKGHNQGDAERHTAELADAEVMRLLTRSGEINKVDPKPAKKQKYLNDNILTVVYQFKKKGGK
jgi:hypothetical protein